jgi:hypothetical protein
MQFGLFGSAAARRGGPEFDSSEGFRDFIEYNIEAEALGFHSTLSSSTTLPGLGDAQPVDLARRAYPPTPARNCGHCAALA